MRIQSVLDLTSADVSFCFDNELDTDKSYLEINIKWNKTKDSKMLYRFYDLEYEDQIHCVTAFESFTAHSMFSRIVQNPSTRSGYIFFALDIAKYKPTGILEIAQSILN